MNTQSLNPELVTSIESILGIQDAAGNDNPLDILGDEFGPVPMLNSLFPDETSLGQISTVQARLSAQEEALQAEIASLQEELIRDQDPARMQVIQEMIFELLGQMSRIREKATESEAVVRNITKDIQVLDLAKRNLILSMTTLKRLQMLVNALAQLDDLVAKKQYAEISQTLAAVKQIAVSFKSYTSVHRMSQAWRRIQAIQGELRSILDKEFDAFFLQTAQAAPPTTLSAACLCVDVLGPEVRWEYIEKYVALELKEYKRIFGVSTKGKEENEAAGLDNLSRRFAWFRRLLTSHETEAGRVFPSEWHVDWALVRGFSDITRDDIAALLSRAGSALTVTVLLEALQAATEFEMAMSKKWATPFSEILSRSAPSPVSATAASKVPKITAAFEPHLGVFIDAQDKALADMLAQHRKNNRARTSLEAPSEASSAQEHDGEEDKTVVLPSSTELFYFYAQSLEQCARLSTGKALFDFGLMCAKWLRIYAEEVLIASMKRPTASQPRRSMDTRIDFDELKQACLIINTADYCQTTALALEDKIRSKIDEKYKEQVSLQVEKELFVGVISTAINAQLVQFEAVADPHFSTVARTSWATMTGQVSGPSLWVEAFSSALESVVRTVKPLVEQKRYVRNLLDKASNMLLGKLINSIVRSRPLKEIGAEQLLIDLQGVKMCLANLPGEDLLTSGYTRSLSKMTSKLEALLKVVVTPVDPPEGFILNYTLLIGDDSISNFQKVLDLKGTPKASQNHLLDTFLTFTSTKSDLESTSFLTSLDMDPSSTSVAVATASTNIAAPSVSRASGLPFSGLASPLPPPGFASGLASPPPEARDSPAGQQPASGAAPKREVFSDLKRFVSLGLRRDSQPPS